MRGSSRDTSIYAANKWKMVLRAALWLGQVNGFDTCEEITLITKNPLTQATDSVVWAHGKHL